MNPEFPNNERVELEAKLTALLLGELHADEVAALSKAMGEDPELAALYERLKVTIELVREMKPAEEQAPLKLSVEKREKLLASFKTVTPGICQAAAGDGLAGAAGGVHSGWRSACGAASAEFGSVEIQGATGFSWSCLWG